MTYLLISLITYIVLLNNKNLTIDICDSYLLDNKDNYKQWAILFGLLFPLTVVLLLKNKQMKSFKAIIILTIVAILTISVGSKEISLYNQSTEITGSFGNDFNKRGTTFDKMKKIVSEQLQVAGIVDTSYSKTIQLITGMRTDGPALVWKWVKENNPNANFDEVSKFYATVTDNITLLRTELQATETLLQADVKTWYLLHHKFPNNVYLFYQESDLKYTPILSDDSKIVNITGVDNNHKIK